jgi:hypothetical protein
MVARLAISSLSLASTEAGFRNFNEGYVKTLER